MDLWTGRQVEVVLVGVTSKWHESALKRSAYNYKDWRKSATAIAIATATASGKWNKCENFKNRSR